MRTCLLVIVAACGAPSSGGVDSGTNVPDAGQGSDGPAARRRLEVRSLGVQGFALQLGGDTVLTAPMFTRQSAFEVTLGLPLAPDTQATDLGLAAIDLS